MYIGKKLKRNICITLSVLLTFNIGYSMFKTYGKQTSFPQAAKILEKTNKDLSLDIDKDDIILTIDDVEVSYEKYKYYLDKEKALVDNGDNSYWDTTKINNETSSESIVENAKITKLELENAVLKKIKNVVALEKLQKEYDIIVTDDEVENEYFKLISTYGKQTIDDLLIEKNLTVELYKEMLRNFLVEEELLNKMFSKDVYENLDMSIVAGYKKILITYSDEIAENNLTQEMQSSQKQSDNLLLKENQNNINNKEVVDETIESVESTNTTIEENIIAYENINSDNTNTNTNTNNNEQINKYSNEKIDYEKNKNKLVNYSIYKHKSLVKDYRENIIITKIDNGIGQVRKLTQLEAKELIDNIYKQLEEGASFDDLLSIYGEDADFITLFPKYVKYGDLKEPENTKLFELEIGEYSAPFIGELGYEIFIRTEPSKEYVEENILSFASDEIWTRYSKIVTEKTNALTVKKNKNYVSAFANAFSTKENENVHYLDSNSNSNSNINK